MGEHWPDIRENISGSEIAVRSATDRSLKRRLTNSYLRHSEYTHAARRVTQPTQSVAREAITLLTTTSLSELV